MGLDKEVEMFADDRQSHEIEFEYLAIQCTDAVMRAITYREKGVKSSFMNIVESTTSEVSRSSILLAIILCWFLSTTDKASSQKPWSVAMNNACVFRGNECLLCEVEHNVGLRKILKALVK